MEKNDKQNDYNWDEFEKIDKAIIWTWFKHWKNNEGASYRDRITGLDANMKYDLGRYIYEYTQSALESANAENAKLRAALEMVDAVGMIEPYDRIVREALEKLK